MLSAGDEQAFREFFAAIDGSRPPETVAWALERFEMGCERAMEAQALSDYLLALRALLDATTEAGQASLALRLAALCAEEDARRDVQHRLEAALALERFVMGGAMGLRPDAESPRELVDEAENHLRALLRDVLCGYLDPDLKGVADDILVEAGPEPFMGPEAGEIEARDLRKEPRFERAPEPVQEPDGLSPTSTSARTPSTSPNPTTTRRPTTRPSSTPSPTPPSSRRSRSHPSPCSTSWTA